MTIRTATWLGLLAATLVGCGADRDDGACPKGAEASLRLALTSEEAIDGTWTTGGRTPASSADGAALGGAAAEPGSASSGGCSRGVRRAAKAGGSMEESDKGGVESASSSPSAKGMADDAGAGAAAGDATSSGEGGGFGGGGQGGPRAGILTAGSFDDGLNFDAFTAFWREQQGPAELAATPGRRVFVVVKDAGGKPVANARVKVGQDLALVTGGKGRVTLFAAWDGLPSEGEVAVEVTPAGGAAVTATFDAAGDEDEWIVTVAGAAAPLTALDVALVVDATGSMGDEISYLKAELDSIVDAVKARFPAIAQRWSLIVYRDHGDEYVTRGIALTSDLAVYKTFLGQQSAGGGGDYPEAMDVALAETMQKLAWGGAGTARVAFVIADAPPHDDKVKDTLAAVETMRRAGVTVFPVASSGVADTAERVMRRMALVTGGEYLFLTDDSGVGNPHAEPHIPCYEVQKLNELMIRMIAGELAGERQEAAEGSVLRTVGKMEKGRCL